MFGTHKKLKAWQEAGLLSEAQLDAISAHEKLRHQGRFGRGMVGLALFAIIVGVLSVIAANWLLIPGGVKIALHLALNILLAATVWEADRRGKEMVREGALLVLGGLTLTLIALTGQVYQLGGSWSGALLLWQLAILPAFFIFGRTRLTVLPALLALVGSVPLIMADYLEPLPEFFVSFYIVMLGTFLPLCLIADGQMKIVRDLRPVWAATSQRVGFVLLTLIASLSGRVWYSGLSETMFRDVSGTGLNPIQAHLRMGAIFVVAALCVGLYRLFSRRRGLASRFYDLTALYVLAGIAMIGLPVIFPGAQYDLFAMVSFLAYWGFIAWYANETGAMRLLSLAIFLLALRIWIIYLEAFGSLLSTGFMLISGGILMLGMIYAARKLNRRLTGREKGHV